MRTKTKVLRHLYLALLILLAPTIRVQAANQTVSNLGDNGLASQVRQKLAACQSGTSPGGTITFSVAGTVTLDPAKGPLPNITTNVTVNGGGTIEISGNNGTRIFNVSTGAILTLNNITLSHAYSAGGDGGAVASTGTLNVNNAKFFNNVTSGDFSGSAILCWGPLNITNCEFAFNTGGGGAVKPRSSGAVTNSAYREGGAIFMTANSTVLQDSTTFTGNTAGNEGG